MATKPNHQTSAGTPPPPTQRTDGRVRKPCLRALAGIIALASLLLAICPACAADQPQRLKRADSFLGIHFDFHAGPDCTEIGKNTTRAMIEHIIEQAHPDYLQIDCKGHR